MAGPTRLEPACDIMAKAARLSVRYRNHNDMGTAALKPALWAAYGPIARPHLIRGLKCSGDGTLSGAQLQNVATHIV